MRETKKQVKQKFTDAGIADPRVKMNPALLQATLSQRSVRFTDRAKEASRRACRGRSWD